MMTRNRIICEVRLGLPGRDGRVAQVLALDDVRHRSIVMENGLPKRCACLTAHDVGGGIRCALARIGVEV